MGIYKAKKYHDYKRKEKYTSRSGGECVIKEEEIGNIDDLRFVEGNF